MHFITLTAVRDSKPVRINFELVVMYEGLPTGRSTLVLSTGHAIDVMEPVSVVDAHVHACSRPHLSSLEPQA